MDTSLLSAIPPSQINTDERHRLYGSPDRDLQRMSLLKEDKTGGVAAYLDYEIDEMVDFVSAMTQGMYDIFSSGICLADIDMARSIVNSNPNPTQEFRKFTSQVLTSTRLPSSTILLALLYLSKRLASLSKLGKRGVDVHGMYSLLIVALVLGSKFLDDNTFQNRSWSEVSNIPVQEINRLEFCWLADIKWDLHIDQDDPDGLRAWLEHWTYFQTRKLDSVLASSLKRTRLEYSPAQYLRNTFGSLGSVRSGLPQPPFGHPSFLHDTHYSAENSHIYPNETLPRPCYDLSPPSAPESAPTTPSSHDFFHTYARNQLAFQRPLKLPSPPQILSASQTAFGVTPSSYFAFQDTSQGHYEHNQVFNLHFPRAYMACA